MNNKKKLLSIIMMLVLVLVLTACGNANQEVVETPIITDPNASIGFWDWILKILAEYTFFLSKLFGNSYALGLTVMTLTVRTIGWPIYAKSNDMSTKMTLAQPELNRIQEKYRGLTDQNSQRRMQMETMQVYKKYKINILGCFLPFLQMPIFIAMYSVVRKMPITPKYQEALNFNFFWTSFSESDWILAILVGVTMLVSQWYSMKKPEHLENKKYKNAQQQQQEKTMKIFMYMMTFMMVSVSLSSAGIAYYWVIGNIYQIFQSFISRKLQAKKMEEMRKKYY